MPPKKSRTPKPNHNPFRIELEEGKPTLAIFTKKPTKADRERAELRLRITTTGDNMTYNISSKALDGAGCVFQVNAYPAEGSIEEHVNAKAAQAAALLAEAERVGRETASAEGQAARRRAIEAEAERLPSVGAGPVSVSYARMPREERVNIRIGEEDMARLEAHAAALGLLPGQAARLLVLKGLKEAL